MAEFDIFISWPARISEPESSAQLTSMETVKENNISLVPNPANACFKIVTPDPDIHLYHITIISIDGRVMLHSTVETDRVVCLESASPGLYLVKITDTLDGSINAAKLIIQ